MGNKQHHLKIRVPLIISLIAVAMLSCADKDTGMAGSADFNKPIYDPDEDGNNSIIKETVRVFEQATEGYHSYRIPSLATAPNGDLIAFAEARKLTSLDYGDIDIVAKISSDRGRTWSALKTVVGEGEGTWGNPTVVTDVKTNRVWLFMSWNSDSHSQHGGNFDGKAYPAVSQWGDRKVYTIYSDDNGLSWSSPVDRTAQLVPLDFIWDAVGPGSGIQIERGPNEGRLIVPAGERNIYSDDNGQTWKFQRIPKNTFEGSIVELSSGLLLRNDRAVAGSWNRGKYRYTSKGSIEGGFSAFSADVNLIDPRSQASILRVSFQPNLVAFINAANNAGDTMPYRCNMTLRLSADDGKTWFASKQLDYTGIPQDELCSLGYGGYTSMAKINEEEIGLLVEQVIDPTAGAAINRKHSIDFHHINLNWIKK
ncbi:sialidase family protein [Sphingobacterium pedocola]|uniref:exo-alpha-sialidase n=1 Tax=Sphingobacterium pedocola TaxID=2082722 RepID=A0ABR9T6Z7_9SPHI|nr:sialidase family protein [Sphingobacterium pedocola]MBE8721103.1 exo-alpha-sialidase [Sphingobacterium pedocola]